MAPIFHLPSSEEDSPKHIPEKDHNFLQSIFAHRFRYFLLFLGAFCLTSVNSNYITFNFTVICLNKPHNDTDGSPSSIPVYDYSQKEKSMLMWAVAIGSIIGTFPFNYLYNHFGARYVFFTAGIVSALSTIMIPKAASWGLEYFLAFRFIQGVAYSADFAALGILCVRWAGLKESAIFLSILTCFSPFSVVITNPVSGLLCESKWGWPSVYYSHGSACLVLFILWIIFYTDEPITHRAVSGVELEKIHRGKSEAHKHRNSYVPYWKICTNPVILAVWLNALTDLVSGIFLLTYTPTYLKSVLNYGVGHTGWLAALPGLSHIPIKLFCGFLSDGIKSIPERKKLMIFNSIALVVPAMMYVALGFVPKEYPMIAVALFTGINGFIGANCGGFYKCSLLVARQYSAFVVGNIQFIKCLTLFIAPGLVAVFVRDESSRDQWRTIFFILALVCVTSNFVFCYYATDEPAEFTTLPEKSAREETTNSSTIQIRPIENA